MWQSRQTKKQIQLTQEQTNYVRQEMDGTLRPWLAIATSDVQIGTPFDEVITFPVKNYGCIPARIVGKRSVFDKTKISKDRLRSTKIENSEMMLVPDATFHMSLILPKEPGYKYIAVMIDYEYANSKHGEYGLIGKRVAKTGTFIYEEVFGH